MPAEKIPTWIKQVLMPELNEIKGELKSVNTRIDALNEKIDTKITALDGKIDSLDERMKTRMTGLDGKIDSLRNEMKSEFTGMNYRVDSLEKSIPVIEKMAVLELKIAEIEKKLAAV